LYSSNKGKSFTSVAPTDLETKLEGGTITSIDVATYYDGGALSLAIGVTGGAGAISNVLLFEIGEWTWEPVGALDNNVLAVAFSPTHMSDAEILAVSENGTDTFLNTIFGDNAWDENIDAHAIIEQADTTGGAGDALADAAVIAFGDDYIGTGTNTILIGTRGTDIDDVIRVKGLALGVDAKVKDLDVSGDDDDDNDVQSIAISGPISTATVLVALAGDDDVYFTSDVTGDVDDMWDDSDKEPTGDGGITALLWAGDNAYAGSTGTDSALSKSTDDGATWNQLSLIDISDIANVSLIDCAIVDEDTMFVIIMDDADASDGWSANDVSMLFKTTDGGETWERILSDITTGTEGMRIVRASPDYATDSTLFVADASTTIQKSTDGGAEFDPIGVPKAVMALAVVDTDTYFAGAADGKLYKSGRWASAEDLEGDVISIAMSPGYDDDETILVGNDDGEVWISTDDGVEFTRIGIENELGAGANVIVVPHPDFVENTTTYAVSSNDADIGVFRATTTEEEEDDEAYEEIDENGVGLIHNGLVISADGALYAASGNATNGIRRCLDPLTEVDDDAEAPTPTAPTFKSMVGTDETAEGEEHKFKDMDDMVLKNLVVAGNTLYTIASTSEDEEEFGYMDRLLTFTDTLTGAVDLSSPKYSYHSKFKMWQTPALDDPDEADLEWEAVDDATQYEVWWDRKSDFSDMEGEATTDETEYDTSDTADLKAGKTYYWKVRVSAPVVGAWSDTWAFYTALEDITDVDAPYAPETGEVDVVLSPTLTWPVVDDADSYQFAIGEDPTFEIIDYAITTPANTHVVTETLKYSTTYYWRVRGISDLEVAAGEMAHGSNWATLSFTTMAKPVEVAEPEPEQVIITEQAPPQIVKVEVPGPTTVVEQPIPSYLLWIIIGIGAILIIALIVLIVRTRRVA
jgi:photosystem II stability/assembly factor-like uncharacterized protein